MSHKLFVSLTADERALAREVCPIELARLEAIEEVLADLRAERAIGLVPVDNDGTILPETIMADVEESDGNSTH